MEDRHLTPHERDQLLRTLDKWMIRCHVALSAYNEATVRANATVQRLGVLASVLSTTVATDLLVTLRSDPSQAWRITAGILAAIAASLTAAQTFIRPTERASQYRETARSYGRIRREIERARLFVPLTRGEASTLLESLATALAEAGRGKPNVPRRVWERAEYKIKGVTDIRGIRALILRIRESMTFGVSTRRDFLPQSHSRYFDDLANAVMVSIDQLEPSVPPEQQQLSVKRAEQFMREAAAGQRDRREPLRVRKNANSGKFVIEDGNATWAVARKYGWETLPVQVVNLDEQD